MTDKDKSRLIDLADAYIEGTISESDLEQLNQTLKADEEARVVYTDYVNIHSILHWNGIDGNAQAIDFTKGQSGNKRWLLPGVATCLAVVALVLIISLVKGANNVAKVIRAETGVVTIGDYLKKGEGLKFEKGVVELVFQETGVHVLVSGPVELSDIDHDYLRLVGGEAKLHVPPQGIGFVVETKEKKITDLGTSFVVTAEPQRSSVFVLDGQISVGADQVDKTDRLMNKGDFADFSADGGTKYSGQDRTPPPVNPIRPNPASLPGRIFTLPKEQWVNRKVPGQEHQDLIGPLFVNLVNSAFLDRSQLESLNAKPGALFRGIVASEKELPKLFGVSSYPSRQGWMAWFRGQVIAPEPGEYRFWGYADNHLVVSVNGKPQLEASRFDTSFRDGLIGVERKDHPSLPCLNATAGFRSGGWFTVGNDPIHLDILFGEMSNSHTSGLLLIEKKGGDYSQTIWGQKRFPLFLTHLIEEQERSQLLEVRDQLEEKLMGSFSVDTEMIWKVK
ncbi:MAG: FecR domain-containing protein [Verrucomicrobiota bacterium]